MRFTMSPGVLLAWDRRWKIGTDLGGGFGADIIPSIGLTAGNVFTYASAGALFRIGRSLSSTWGPTRIRPAPSGASFFDSDPSGPSWGFAVFGGDGGTRGCAQHLPRWQYVGQSSPSVTKKVFVGDVIEGIEFFTQAGSRVAFSVTERSKEYTTQPYNDIFGSVEASFKFLSQHATPQNSSTFDSPNERNLMRLIRVAYARLKVVKSQVLIESVRR